MNNKEFKILVALTSNFGDILCRVPVLTLLEKIYPNSYKVVYLDAKCNSIVPLLKHHPLIDDIYISDKNDEITKSDLEYFKKFHIIFNPYPQVIHPHWFNLMSVQYANVIMMETIYPERVRISEEDLARLTPEEWKPRLNQWFKVEKKPKKSIAILPFSGYSNDKSIDLRSPAPAWWLELIPQLKKMNYDIYQYGHPKSELLASNDIIDRRNLSLFEMVKEILGCDFVIGTDSGAMHILGAYGFPQIILYTNYMAGHNKNLGAYLPVNCDDKGISLFGSGGINNIKQKDVINAIKTLK